MKRLLVLCCTLLPGWLLASTADLAVLQQQRQLFLQAERQLGSAPEPQIESWLTELRDYPLRPYLEQRWLQRRLSDQF